ncbi:ABC transporter permease [Aminobacter sp. BE322]|uniref:ABC transporter permease n=1 Tax=unclassified Aminobacter TaxID=2644704 RepID=UPI003D1DF868
MHIKLEQRHASSLLWQGMSYGLAIMAGFAATAVLLKLSSADVSTAFAALLRGAFGSQRAVLRTLVDATPLILTGLAALVVFRARIWSIGQEGQVYAGAMGAYWVASSLPDAPLLVVGPLAIAGAMLGGATMSGIAAVLRNRYEVNEIFSTVMLNYIVVYLLSWLLAGEPWTEAGTTVAYHQTQLLAQSAWLPQLSGPLHAGILIAIAAAIADHLLLERTSAGYDMRALGANQTALRFMGMDVPRVVLVTMLLSGALAGLAGGVELLGVQQAAAATGAPADRAHRHADHRHRHRLRLHLAVLFLQELQGPLQRAAEPAPLLLKL